MIQYNTKSWARVMFRVHGTVLSRIIGRTMFVVVVALVLVYLHKERHMGLPISGALHAMVGVALGLLLVFRTNASYDRFWEGRKLVGELVNNSRDLARQADSYLSKSPAETRAQVRTYTVALYSTIHHYLRGETDFGDLVGVLSAKELGQLNEVRAPPLLVAGWLTKVLVKEADEGRLSEMRLRLFDTTISDILDCWGGCERIVKTPVPFAYAHHIKGFLTIFCVTSPLAMVQAMGWYTPLAAAVVAYGLYGIDEIGVEIEDPFGDDPNDLPLHEIKEAVVIDVNETIR